MADIRITAIGTNASTLANDDEFPVDSAALGTQRIRYDEVLTKIAADLVASPSTYKVATLDSLDKLVTNQRPASEAIILQVGDETTNLSTGDGKLLFRMPYAFTLSAVRISVGTAPVGSTIIVDIEEGGTTILSTLLTIDASEKTSTTAATPAVISDTALSDASEIGINIDQVGSSTPGKGLKVYLIGNS